LHLEKGLTRRREEKEKRRNSRQSKHELGGQKPQKERHLQEIGELNL